MEKHPVLAADRARALRDAVAGASDLAFLGPLMTAHPRLEWFLVGGGVRDVILGRGLSTDIDLVARNLPIDELMRALSAHGKVDLVGKAFGVIKFMAPGSSVHVDIALPRTELSHGSGARRDFDVRFDEELPIEDDLSRRDFTVNAMAWNIGKGELVDPRGGLRDLDAKVIAAVGRPEDRFREDLSRMLRGIRFACQLGFAVAPGTWDAIVRLAPKINGTHEADGKAERLVPYEIVAKELVKALAADAVRAVRLFEESGLLFRVIPEIADMAHSTMCDDHHGGRDVWEHSKDALSQLYSDGFAERFPGEAPDVETALAVLLHDVGKPPTRRIAEDGEITNYGHDAKGAEMVEAIASRLRLSSVPGHVIDAPRLAWLVRMHLFPNMVDLGAVRNGTLHRHFLADPERGRKLLHVAYADAMATRPVGRAPDLSVLDALMARLDGIGATLGGGTEPEKLISGDEVMTLRGLTPGPDVGRLLNALRDAQLEGRIETAEDAKRFIEGLE